MEVRVLRLEGLLLTKEGMRDKDKADATVLVRAIEARRKASLVRAIALTIPTTPGAC